MTTSHEMRVLAWLQHRLIQQEPQIWSGKEQIIVEEIRTKPRHSLLDIYLSYSLDKILARETKTK